MSSPTSPAPGTGKRTAALVGIFIATIMAAGWMNHTQQTLYAVLLYIAGAVAAVVAWKKLTPRPPEGGPESPMVSLVLLLKQPRYLEPVVLAEVIRDAWGVTVDAGGVDGNATPASTGRGFIVGNSPLFMVNTGDAMFVVHNHERQYFDNIEDIAVKVPELRLRTIILEHKAWLSVDAMGVDAGEDATPHYGRISKLLANLADDSVLGLFQPASNRLTPWDPSLVERLRQGEGLDELFRVNQTPVVHIASDDPRMQAAVAEARRRWPEFVAAFKARKPEGNYAVKAAVTREGNTEFIWLEVVGLEPEYIHGKLANDPVALGDLKIGDQVEVPLADLNDWTFSHGPDDEPAGLFTVKILTETYGDQLKRARE